MNKLKENTMRLFFLIMLLVIFCHAEKTNIIFDGKWIWVKNSDTKDFSILIEKTNTIFNGYYCAVFLKGNRIDCNEDKIPSFAFKYSNTNIIITEFTSYYSQTSGEIKLTFNNNELLWEVIKTPSGIFYCPTNALLIKQTNQ